jgi:hypothetical protein
MGMLGWLARASFITSLVACGRVKRQRETQGRGAMDHECTGSTALLWLWLPFEGCCPPPTQEPSMLLAMPLTVAATDCDINKD